MIKELIGKKLGMTQIFNNDGEAVPVTVVYVDDSVVVDKKTPERDGYSAIKVGTLEVKKPKNMNKAVKGIFINEKGGKNLPLKQKLSEIRLSKEEADKINVGDKIGVGSVFKEGDWIDVSGVTKGKGFAGAVKRHGFGGGPTTHGSMQHRAVGSIGSNTYPAHVWKGKKMAGRMGGANVTIQNLRVVKVDADNRYVLIRGAVPGANNGLILIKKAVKKK